VALSSLVEGLSLKVTGIKCPQASDNSLFASGCKTSNYKKFKSVSGIGIFEISESLK